MADATRVLNQVRALLNAAPSNLDGSKNYAGVGTGDKARPIEEITETCLLAAIQVALAICETEGHPLRAAFVEPIALTHNEIIPEHYGGISIPDIVPYAGAGYTVQGTRSDYSKINSYRINENNVYDDVAHNEEGSLLSGLYDVVNTKFYFTGESATMDLATFDRTDIWDKLPEAVEPAVIKVALGDSAKEGDMSDGLFAAWYARGQNDIASIRSGETVFEPVDQQIAARGKTL